jgi:hypothetical protein
MAGFSLERAFVHQQGDVDPGRRTDPEVMRGMLWILPAIVVALVIAGLVIGLT